MLTHSDCLICCNHTELCGDFCYLCLNQQKNKNPDLFSGKTRYKYSPQDKVWVRYNGLVYFAEILEYNPFVSYDKGRIKVKIESENFKQNNPKHESITNCCFIEVFPTNQNQEIETIRYFLVDQIDESIHEISQLMGDVNIYPKYKVGDLILFANQKCEIISIEKREKLKQFEYGVLVVSSKKNEVPLVYTQHNSDEFTLIPDQKNSI